MTPSRLLCSALKAGNAQSQVVMGAFLINRLPSTQAPRQPPDHIVNLSEAGDGLRSNYLHDNANIAPSLATLLQRELTAELEGEHAVPSADVEQLLSRTPLPPSASTATRR